MELLDVVLAALGIGVVCTYGIEGFADAMEPFSNTFALACLVLLFTLVALMF